MISEKNQKALDYLDWLFKQPVTEEDVRIWDEVVESIEKNRFEI